MDVSKVTSCQVRMMLDKINDCSYISNITISVRTVLMQEFQKYVFLVMDEMHIKEDLVYNKDTGALVGFVNLGDINSHLLKFEQSLSGEEHATEPLAKSMLTIMVRGLFTKLQFPYAQFPCKTISGDLMYDHFWEAVCHVER